MAKQPETPTPTPTPNSVTVQATLEKETANALRYQECEADGTPVERAFAKIGTFYVPKATLGKGNQPKRLTLTVAW